MKGDMTKTYPEKEKNIHNFTGVLHQQGKVLIDRDFNDRTFISTNWQDQAGRDIIGNGIAAVPATEIQNFKIKQSSIDIYDENNKISFNITPGRLWADGLLLYNEDPQLEKVKRLAIKHPLFRHNEDSSSYAVLLELWRESINGFQIPEDLLEPALGGVDTTQRLHTAYAFRLLKLPSESDPNCVAIQKIIRDILAKKKGRLTVVFNSNGEKDGSSGEGETGYIGLENRNYRIEVAEGNEGPPYNLVKWSRCNGGLVGRGKKKGNIIEITANLDAIISSGSKKFYLEIIQLNEGCGFWEPTYGARVQLNNNNFEIIGTPHLNKETNHGEFFLRLWDGIFPVRDELFSLEDGISLKFDTINWINMRPGDYWTFQVRVNSKPFYKNSKLPKDKKPDGINYHLVPFALISRNKDATLDLTDCRIPFHSLTEQKDENASNGFDKKLKLPSDILEILEFDYKNLHDGVWNCHKVTWQATSIFIPILFILEGYFIQMLDDLSFGQVVIATLATWFLVIIWRLMMHVLGDYNSKRTGRLKEIERIIDEQQIEGDLIKHYRLFDETEKRSSKEGSKIITWTFIYHLIVVLISILNIISILLKIFPSVLS